MSFQQWDPTSLPIRPGLYINFKEAAIAQITGGARGTVAIPLKTFAGQAVAKKFYTIEREGDAVLLFGQANIQSVKFALQGGAKEVLVYTLPASATATDYVEMREAFEARPFNVFVFDAESSADEQDNTLAWVVRNREEKKHFMFVAGGTAADDLDPAVGNARSVGFNDDYVVNLINGVTINGVDYSSAQYAPYVAGLIAGTAINKSVTYTQVAVDDVTKRLRNSEIVAALGDGSFVLVHDGEKVKVEQGLTTSGKKIRNIRARQAVATDIEKTARDSYIGKIDNTEAGRDTLFSGFKSYLETLETNNVLIAPTVGQNPQIPSTGDQVFAAIAYTEVDSMERIFLEITV
jgi:hypothetical protein